MSYRHLVLILAVAAACRPAPDTPPATDRGPQVRATVVAIRTESQPDSRKHEHTIVIAGDRARSTREHDVWRLFDLKAQTVTFVDEIGKTVRTEPLETILNRRRSTTAGPLPPHYPRPRLVGGGETRQMHGVPAELAIITSGSYRRDLWLAEHPKIPRGLFSMMYASEAPTSPLAPMMSAVDEAIIGRPGFPMLDRTEVPYGAERLIVQRNVVSITEREVPESLLRVPSGYLDLTPKAAQ